MELSIVRISEFSNPELFFVCLVGFLTMEVSGGAGSIIMDIRAFCTGNWRSSDPGHLCT